MSKLSLYPLVFSGAFLLASPGFSTEQQEFSRKAPPPVPSRQERIEPSQTATLAKAPLALGAKLRKVQEEVKESSKFYPQTFTSKQLKEIINAPYDNGRSSTEAVRIDDNFISLKISDATLENIKKAVHEEFLNGRKKFNEIHLSAHTIDVPLHPQVIAIFSDIIQANYRGSTASSEQGSEGFLLHYKLMFKGSPLTYRVEENRGINAILTLSVTHKKKG
jgi:hypothetical protein